MGTLLHWGIVLLVIALIAALFGLGGVAGTAMEGARLLIWAAIIVAIIMVVVGFVRRGRV